MKLKDNTVRGRPAVKSSGSYPENRRFESSPRYQFRRQDAL